MKESEGENSTYSHLIYHFVNFQITLLMSNVYFMYILTPSPSVTMILILVKCYKLQHISIFLSRKELYLIVQVMKHCGYLQYLMIWVGRQFYFYHETKVVIIMVWTGQVSVDNMVRIVMCFSIFIIWYTRTVSL